MKVKDCNIDDEHQIVNADENLLSVKNRYCHILLVVKDKKPVGIVTNNDLVKKIKNETDYTKLKFKDIMSSPVVTVRESDDLDKAGRFMYEKGFMSLPVVDNKNNLVGLLTYFDYLGKIGEKIRNFKKMSESKPKQKSKSKKRKTKK